MLIIPRRFIPISFAVNEFITRVRRYCIETIVIRGNLWYTLSINICQVECV